MKVGDVIPRDESRMLGPGETRLEQEVGAQGEVKGHSQHWCGALPLVTWGLLKLPGQQT